MHQDVYDMWMSDGGALLTPTKPEPAPTEPKCSCKCERELLLKDAIVCKTDPKCPIHGWKKEKNE